MTPEEIADVLEQHIQIERNKRCICGWRPTFPQNVHGWESFQHRRHLAEELAKATNGR